MIGIGEIDKYTKELILVALQVTENGVRII